MQWDQSASDSLSAARQALERAEEAYEECRGEPTLSYNSGPLFSTLDNLDTALTELQNFRGCSVISDIEWNSWLGLKELRKGE